MFFADGKVLVSDNCRSLTLFRSEYGTPIKSSGSMSCLWYQKEKHFSIYRESPWGHGKFRVHFQSSSKSVPPTPEYLQYLNKSLFGHDGQEDLPTLVCRGCVRCYMYVMVSDSAPKCPKCKSTNLLEIPSPSDSVKRKARSN